jgi:RNA polymerase sigma-70 factor (ECF subfamily)
MGSGNTPNVSLQASLERPAAAPAASSPPSFDVLYDTHVDSIWRLLLRLGVEPMNAEDAVQEVFVTAWKRLAQFEHRSSLKTWLTGIALNVAAHARRGLARHGRPEPLDDGMPSGASLPDERAQAREDLAQLQQVLKQLPDEQREAFVMLEMEGFSAPEASALLNVGVNTLYSRLRLARAAFNAAVAEVKEAAR